MKWFALTLLVLATPAFAANGPVTVIAAAAWASDNTVKVACTLDGGTQVVLPSPLPQQVAVPTPPGNGLAVTRIVSCFSFRGSDPNAPTIRSVAVSDSQTFPALLDPPSLSH